MAEDQALGTDAQFTVNVDGQQIGGVQTVTASQSAGQTEPFTFLGNFAPGPHNITVSFVNNFIYPGLSGDRNLYVDGVTYDGQSVSNTTTPIYETALYPPNSTAGNFYGNATFQVNDTTSIPSGAASQPTTTPAPVSVGSGADTLVLNMAEDAYQGDAQFTVSVDGKQVGGTQTTTALVDDGQSQEFDVHGDFGPGTHTVSVDFLNDKIDGFYPGTQLAIDTTDRNLYVMGASLDGGAPASGAPWELSSDGSHDFTVTAGNDPSATAGSSGLFASDGAAATSSNPALPAGSLDTGSMSFISSPSGSDTSGSTTSSDTSSSGTMSTDTTSTNPTSSGATTASTASTDPTASGTTQTDPTSSGTTTATGSSDGTAPGAAPTAPTATGAAAATGSSDGTSSGATSMDPTSAGAAGSSGGTSSSTTSNDLSSTVGTATPTLQDVSGAAIPMITPTATPTSGTDTASNVSGSGAMWSTLHHSGQCGVVSHQG
jgi:hypothetical protein